MNIVECAAQLLREQGTHAVTTRAVAQAAGMQAPTIYRFFEDKDALLDAVAEHVFATYVAGKTLVEDSGDPVADLRAGWDTHIGFGLANAALFGLLIDPSRGARSPAAAAGLEVLRARVHRVAAIGRLRVTERRAVELIHAAGTGAVLTLLSTPPEHRDLDLADAMYEAVMRSILTGVPTLPADNATAVVVAFRAVAPKLTMLTDAERALLSEWLDRASDDPTTPGASTGPDRDRDQMPSQVDRVRERSGPSRRFPRPSPRQQRRRVGLSGCASGRRSNARPRRHQPRWHRFARAPR